MKNYALGQKVAFDQYDIKEANLKRMLTGGLLAGTLATGGYGASRPAASIPQRIGNAAGAIGGSAAGAVAGPFAGAVRGYQDYGVDGAIGRFLMGAPRGAVQGAQQGIEFAQGLGARLNY